jgi:hypothetical protein
VIYESLELDRLVTMSSAMRKFCKIERDLLETRLKYLSLLEQGAVTFLNPQEDLALYVSQEKNSMEAQRRSYAIQLLHLSHMNRCVLRHSLRSIHLRYHKYALRPV